MRAIGSFRTLVPKLSAGAAFIFAASGRAALSTRAAVLPLTALTCVSPIDGRYGPATADLRGSLSEYALIKHRVEVEVAWLRVLAAHTGISEVPALSAEGEAALDRIVKGFDLKAAERVKTIEATTNHDVKAVEYYLKEAFAASGCDELVRAQEFLHFAATSEDVNNLAYALMVKAARDEVLLPAMKKLLGQIVDVAEQLAEVPMLSRTHGQPATPSTMGKEWANWAYRLGRQMQQLKEQPVLGKWNGAVGSFNAHDVAYPGVDWEKAAKSLIGEQLGLSYNPYSTQIEPHDWLAETFNAVERFNTILLDLDRDVWGYISLGYFRQRPVAGEIGSSTMPHKINPIDFENSEGNVGLANAMLHHMAAKLPVSRFQRDLSDSTVLRSIGPAFGHTLLAIKSASRGIGKLDADKGAMAADLDSRWEVLAEPIQTVMRRYGAPKPYEQLKELTRGHGAFSSAAMRSFVQSKLVEGQQVPLEAGKAMLELSPATYVGEAPRLAKGIRAELKGMGIEL